MTVKIELITDNDLLEIAKPLIDIATAYTGHLNYSYTKGIEYTSLDIQHKNLLLEKLRGHPTAKYFVIGCGSGHIYVNRPTACDTEDKSLISNNGIHDRILLITD